MSWVKSGSKDAPPLYFPFEDVTPVIGIDCHNVKRGEVITCSNFTNRPHAIVELKIPTRLFLLRHKSGMLCYHIQVWIVSIVVMNGSKSWNLSMNVYLSMFNNES